MKTYYIYKATNIIDGKSYVGYTTTTPDARKSCHFSGAEKHRDNNSHFYNAIRLYGKENFTWNVLKDNIHDILMLKLMETFMIMVHKTHWTEGGYNMTWGGDGCLGHKHTIETKLKMSKSAKGKNTWSKGKPHNDEWKRKLGDAHRGKIISKETREKMSIAKLGTKRQFTDEHRKNLSKANVGRKYGVEARQNMSLSHIGKKQSDESRKKRSLSMLGKNTGPKSEETRRKISETLRRKNDNNFTVQQET